MKIVVFGLSVSSSWGNGHATLWRGLCRALDRLGHCVVFFERDVPYYATARDWLTLPGDGELVLYPSWTDVQRRAETELRDADVAILTSFCPDADGARAAMLDAARPLALFYDLDTPVTLERVRCGERPAYIGDGLEPFDLVLSYAGGMALDGLRSLGAARVETLYGHVDPDVHRPVAHDPLYACSLSWLGTYAADRQAALQDLFVECAKRRPDLTFTIGGAQYPDDFPWTDNIRFLHHVPPHAHASFLCSSRLTLNITREPMRGIGWGPSGRLFEAAACAAAVASDDWPGLADFYEPGREILVVRTHEDLMAALDLEETALRRVGSAARERTLAQHTSMHRAVELTGLVERTWQPEVLMEES